jgi:predicted TIM-barrel fold metal-dependent hydrolase
MASGVVHDQLTSTFGAERVMVASNFPVDRLFAPLDTLFGTHREWLSTKPESEQRKMLHDNTCRIYGLDG